HRLSGKAAARPDPEEKPAAPQKTATSPPTIGSVPARIERPHREPSAPARAARGCRQRIRRTLAQSAVLMTTAWWRSRRRSAAGTAPAQRISMRGSPAIQSLDDVSPQFPAVLNLVAAAMAARAARAVLLLPGSAHHRRTTQ